MKKPVKQAISVTPIEEAVQEDNKDQKIIQIQSQLQTHDIKENRKVIVLLEKAYLDTMKIGKDVVLLNCDDHRQFIQTKLRKDYSLYRPDITHQTLLTIMDSPLNKAGFVQVYIHTENNVLIWVNPNTKIPRTFKRFSSLMAQLLSKLKIRAEQSSESLLKVIKNPITEHLPQECFIIGTSCHAKVVNTYKYVQQLPVNKPVMYVVGAVSTGDPAMEVDYCQEYISVSKYPLSASNAIGKILNSYEDIWEI